MSERRVSGRVLVLAALTVAAAVILATSIRPRGTADTQGRGPARGAAEGAAGLDPAVPPALGLEKMQAERTVPTNRRDLFRFGSAAPEQVSDPGEGRRAGQPPGARRGAPAEEPIDQPAVPPPPPPIPLRFVGLLEDRGGRKIAALSDGRYVYNAREGDVIEGRWRVVKIGVESLVIERIDGTGRQTLRYAGGGG